MPDQQTDLSASLAALPIVDWDLALDRSLDDEEFLKETLALFRESAREQLEAIARAISGSAPDTLREVAHSLKGSSATVGADRFSAVAKELERMGREKDLTHAPVVLQLLRDEAKTAFGLMDEFVAGRISVRHPAAR